MALVLGTNCGFVTSAPVADPDESSSQISAYASALRDTSPLGSIKVTEIGWWCDNATQESNFEVCIYDNNVVDNNPEAVVGSISTTNAKGIDAGWKVVTGLNIEITAGTIYWIAIQVDSTASATNYNTISSAGNKLDKSSFNKTSLSDPWGASALELAYLGSIYAIYEVAESSNRVHVECLGSC